MLVLTYTEAAACLPFAASKPDIGTVEAHGLSLRWLSRSGAIKQEPEWWSPVHVPHEQSQDLWQHDHIQFARLLSELDMVGAIGLDTPWWSEFQQSTDLEPHEVRELLERAHEAHQRHKNEILTA